MQISTRLDSAWTRSTVVGNGGEGGVGRLDVYVRVEDYINLHREEYVS